MTGWRLAHLPVLLAVTGVLLVATTGVAWVARGGTDAAGAAAGVGLVAASYLLSTLVIAWADSVRPSLVLPWGLATYVLKVAVIGMVMGALSARGWPGLVAMVVGVAVGVVGWTATQVWWVVRHQPDPSQPGAPVGADEVGADGPTERP